MCARVSVCICDGRYYRTRKNENILQPFIFIKAFQIHISKEENRTESTNTHTHTQLTQLTQITTKTYNIKEKQQQQYPIHNPFKILQQKIYNLII